MISLDQALIASFGAIVSLLWWFIKREFSKFEERERETRTSISNIEKHISQAHGRLDELSKLVDHVPDMRRFFGPKGGQARLWGRMEHDMGQIREREHFLIGKMSVIKGSLEVAGIKCGNPDTIWHLPEWKSYQGDADRQ
jgi:hypothetical protein